MNIMKNIIYVVMVIGISFLHCFGSEEIQNVLDPINKEVLSLMDQFVQAREIIDILQLKVISLEETRNGEFDGQVQIFNGVIALKQTVAELNEREINNKKLLDALEQRLTAIQTQVGTLQLQLMQQGQLNAQQHNQQSNPTSITVTTNTGGNTVNTPVTVSTEQKTTTATNKSGYHVIYDSFINVKSLLCSILVLGTLVKEGPSGAAIIVTLLTTGGLVMHREAVKYYINKVAMIAGGTVVAVTACLIVYHAKDKDLQMTALFFVPISIGLTGLFASA
jgi:hypothetical protein